MHVFGQGYARKVAAMMAASLRSLHSSAMAARAPPSPRPLPPLPLPLPAAPAASPPREWNAVVWNCNRAFSRKHRSSTAAHLTTVDQCGAPLPAGASNHFAADVFALMETATVEQSLPHLYRSFARPPVTAPPLIDGHSISGGVALYHTHAHRTRRRDDLTRKCRNAVAIEQTLSTLNHGIVTLIIIVFYRRHEQHRSLDGIIAVMTRALEEEHPVLFMGDFNARCVAFGGLPSPQAEGNRLHSWMCAQGLTLLNTHFDSSRNVATYHRMRGAHDDAMSSVLDLAITNAPHLFSSLTVNDDRDTEHCISDHRAIRASIALASRVAPPLIADDAFTALRWNVHRGDWEAYKAASQHSGILAAVECDLLARRVATTAPSPSSPAQLQQCMESMWTACTSAMSTAARDARIPTFPSSRRRPRTHAWSMQLHALHLAAARARIAYRRQREANDDLTAVLERDWKSAEREFRDAHVTAKRSSWDDLANAVASGDGKRLCWAAFNRTRGVSASAGAIHRVQLPVGTPPPVAAPPVAAHPIAPIAALVRDAMAAAADAGDTKRGGAPASAPVAELPSPQQRPPLPLDGFTILAQHFASACTIPADARDTALITECGDGDAPVPLLAHIDPALRPANHVAMCNAPITREMIADACTAISLQGAYGPDNVPQHFIRYAAPPLITALHAMVSFSFEHAVVPLDWRSANVCALLKSRGEDPTAPSSYRPVSLTSVGCKSLVEAVLLPRIRAIVVPQLHRAQCGFIKGRGCADPLFKLRAHIDERTRRPQSRLAVAFIDVKAAFDRVWHSALLAKMHRLGIVGKTWRWARAWLTGRRMRIVHRGRSSPWVTINAGVPQGAVLSPDFFNIFFDDLPRTAPPTISDIEWLMLADDVAVLANTPTSASIRSEAKLSDAVLSLALDHLTAYLRQWRCIANVPKSAVVLFCQSRRGAKKDTTRSYPPRVCFPLDADVRTHSSDTVKRWCMLEDGKTRITRELNKTAVEFKLDGKFLPIVDQYRYLGIVFHHTTRWDAHMRSLIPKLRTTASHITRLLRNGNDTGPRTPVIRQLVNSLIVPVIAYGAHVWTPWLYKKKDGTRTLSPAALPLQSCLARALVRSLGFNDGQHVHHQSVLAECGVMDVQAIADRALIAFMHTAATDTSRVTHAAVMRSLANCHNTDGMTARERRAFIRRHRCTDYLIATRHAHRTLFPLAATERDGDTDAGDYFDPDYDTWATIQRRHLSRRALLDAFTRWRSQPQCSDLIRWRHLRYTPDGTVLPGIAQYLLTFSRRSVIAMARCRFNRNDTSDSHLRRGFPEFKEGGTRHGDRPTCTRCAWAHTRRPHLAPLDTVEHFLAVCQGDNEALTTVRNSRHYRDLPWHDTAAMLGEPPVYLRTCTNTRIAGFMYKRHLVTLDRFWSTLSRLRLSL